MVKKNVTKFLRYVADNPYLQQELVVKSKNEVLNNAKNLGFDFTENEFDDVVWGLEELLAQKRGENFDHTFSLWTTMWGKYYLQYMIDNVVNSVSDPDIEQVLTKS
ncbi:MAG: Nif11-like leader peptide family natural product precursor [Cyanobacteria bacterium J06639_18]